MQDIMAQADECWRRSRECEYLAKAVPARRKRTLRGASHKLETSRVREQIAIRATQDPFTNARLSEG